MRAAAGYLFLFVFYQLPQGVQDYGWPNRAVWLAATALFFAAAAWLARRMGGEGLRTYALRWNPRWKIQLISGLAAGFACAAGASAVSWSLGLYRIDSVTPWRPLLLTASLLALGSAAASLSEDILTRGYVWWQGDRQLGSLPFCLLSAVLYTGNHIYVLHRGLAMWTFLFVFGLGLAYALHRTGSLWLAFGAHWGWNLVFHWSNAAFGATQIANPSVNTWVSAGGSAVLLCFLVSLSARLHWQPRTCS